MSKNIEMNYFNGSTYEKIVPSTIASDNSCFLTAETAALFGLGTDAVPNDVFQKILLGPWDYGFFVRVKDTGGVLLPNVTVSGIQTADGDTCVTNIKGYVLGVSKEPSVELSFSHQYVDINSIDTISVTSTSAITVVEVVAERVPDGVIIMTSSRKFKFSPGVISYDAAACGGGGGGGGTNTNATANRTGGGGGGQVNEVTGLIPIYDTEYTATIGAGGKGGPAWYRDQETVGSSGGSSSLSTSGETLATASGGGAGSASGGGGGNGNGGFYTGNGGDATTTISWMPCSGGGAGGASGKGGSPNGGSGGASGITPGGGGGGATGRDGAAGGAGAVGIRCHY